MANLELLSGQVLRDADGDAYTGAKAYYWADAGLSIPLDTYSTAALTSANTNPVVADGTTGAFGPIYLAAKRYWRSVTTSGGVSLPQFDLGPIEVAPGWVTSSSAPSPTYPFLVWIDTSTSPAHKKRRASDDLSWIDEGEVDALIAGATVTQQLAGTASNVASTPDSVAGMWQRGTSITPSAGTVSLPSTGGGVYTINAGNFSSISSAAGGRIVIFEFAGASTITHNASSMDLPGNANITTAAGDRAAFVNLAAQDATGSNWRCLWFVRDDGSWPGVFATQAQQETGAQTTFPINSANQVFHDSALKGWTAFDGTGTPTATDVFNFASGSSGITDNGAGDFTLTYSTAFSTTSGYALAGMTIQASAGNTTANVLQARGTAASIVATSSVRVNSGNANTGSPGDVAFNSVMFAGDR